ncbi:hypothetical protein HID58_053529 [Brassica napus]|uniref:Protein S-acyltransferase n=1 Tax=Brassica napus TaxID=3708 RepID=A0ABQ8AGI0_BRANA|nr:hypothetical protein HID58_053529 [Brassica napus]
MKRKGFGFSLPVTAVILVIGFIYFSTVFTFIDRWLSLASSPGIANAAAFTALALMCVYNYSIAVFRDPGRVPPNYMPDVEDPQSPVHEIKRKVLLVGSLTVEPQDEDQEMGSYLRTIYVISGLVLVPLSIALGVLLGWHVYLSLQNKTTIEYHEGVRAMWLAEKGGQVYKHPYDIGAYENLTLILGPNILSWLCPTSKHIGSGLRFRTAFDSAPVSSGTKP